MVSRCAPSRDARSNWVKSYVDEIVTVSEREIATRCCYLLEIEKPSAEGAAAVPSPL